MSRPYRLVRRVIYCLIAITLMLSGPPVMAQQLPIGHLIQVGSYSDIYAGLARAAVAPTATPTATPTPALTPTAADATTSIPAAAPFGTSAAGEALPMMPITIGAALLLFIIVLVAGRRRK